MLQSFVHLSSRRSRSIKKDLRTGRPDADERLIAGAGLDLLGRLTHLPDTDSRIGQTLGDYQISEFIAEGGMGRVYRAHRTDGSFDREVAIKVSASAGMNQSMRERFEREQSVLAGLNHPHITQLYDARVSADGSPYIVMELVEGRSFTDYCLQEQLSVKERVGLLIDVVDAVACAHARLVVHRDIKPSNVLIDHAGAVKLLDFGIAKLLEPGATELTQSRPMTPLYASPEQLLGKDVTIASDIYQLGLLIYEAVAQRALHQNRSMADAIQTAAAQTPDTLDHQSRHTLTLELALIVEQCLRVSPADRYRGASSLQADLQRYLDGYPVLAARQSLAYRLRKWIGRNRLTAAIGTLATLVLVAGAAWYTHHLGAARSLAEQEAASAALQARKSDRVSSFLVELLGAAKPGNQRGEPLTVRELLDQGVQRVREELSDELALQASLLETMGDVYSDLAEFDQAKLLLTESINIRRELDEPNPLGLASALSELAQMYRTQGDYGKSMELLEQGLGELEGQSGRAVLRQRAILHNGAGFTASKSNNFDDAERHYKAAMALRSEIFGPDHLQTSQSVSSYGVLLFKQGKFHQALPLLRQSLEIADEVLGPYHPVISTRAINLANTLSSLRRWEESEPLMQRAVEVDRHLYGPDHHFVGSSLMNLANIRWRLGAGEEAAELMQQALSIETQSLGEDHPDTGNTRYRMADVLIDLGRLDEAENHLQDAHRIFESAFQGDHIYWAEWALRNARLFRAKKQSQQAQAQYQFSAKMLARLFDPTHPTLLTALTESAALFETTGELDQAVMQQAIAVEGLKQRLSERSPEMRPHYENYARMLKKNGQSERAAEILELTRSIADAEDG